MTQDRRILLEAMIVSVLGHAIFFSVFTAKRAEPAAPEYRAPAFIAVARLPRGQAGADPLAEAPKPADPERVALVEIERRTAAPMLEAERKVFLPEDEPDLGPTPALAVGPEVWGFRKDPGRLEDEFSEDFDVAPSLDAAREALSGTEAEGPPLRYTFDVPFIKAPQAGVLRLGPGQIEGPDVRTFRGEIHLNPATRRFEYTFRPSGDPQIDAGMLREIHTWKFKIERTADGYKLVAWLRLPKSIPGGDAKRHPPAADEVYGDEP